MSLNFVAVSFSYPLEADVRVAIADLPAFCQTSKFYRVARVHWLDDNGVERWSYGKCWYRPGTLHICHIGAGAYGDTAVWSAR